MKPASLVAALVVTIATSLMTARSTLADDEVPTPGGKSPSLQAQQYFSNDQFSELDAMLNRLASTKERTQDGRYQLYIVTADLREWFGLWDEDLDSTFSNRLDAWREQFPKSAAEPIVEAMHASALAWRARGGGFADRVAPEAWDLFHKRNERAWRILMDNRKTASTLPTWYELAISVGFELNKPDGELAALLDEGIARFPGYHSIYFAYARKFAPRWGGSYEAGDAFIQKVVAAKTNPEGEALYTRLYWLLDQTSGSPEDFFTVSLVSWRRMRTGFELLMKEFPNSPWNLANFAIFACRARDGATYTRLRPKVDAGQARLAGDDAYSMEVCDARFMKEADNRPAKPADQLARNTG